MAHITARMPFLTIAGADMSLPKIAKMDGASERPFTSITLQVRWDRAQYRPYPGLVSAKTLTRFVSRSVGHKPCRPRSTTALSFLSRIYSAQGSYIQIF